MKQGTQRVRKRRAHPDPEQAPLPDGWWYVTAPTQAFYAIYVVDGLIVTSVMGIAPGASFRMWHDVWTKWGWRIARRTGEQK